MENYLTMIIRLKMIMPLLIQLEHIKLLHQTDFIFLVFRGGFQEIAMN